MKRSGIQPDLTQFPEEAAHFLEGAALYDSSCSPEARVIFIDRDDGLFLSLGAIVMFFLDRAIGANYWFMAGPSGDSPFLGAWERGGYGGYLAAFLLTALAVTCLWYGLRYLLFVRGRGIRR